MASKYVVEVSMPPGVDLSEATETLARAFNVDSGKVSSLLGRLPSVVTRPVSQREAQAVARRFTEAGLAAVVQARDAGPNADVVDSGPASAPEGADRPSPGATQVRATDARLRRAASRGGAAVATPPEAAPAQKAPRRAKRQARPKTPRKARGKEKASGGAEVKRAMGGIRGKLMSVAIIPTVLTILGALTVIWLTARPALYEQLLESARNPAIATAASLSAVLEESSGGGSDYLQLLQTILVAREAFARQNIAFIVATDTRGNPLSAYFAGGESFGSGLETAVQQQALTAVAGRGAQGEEIVRKRIPAANGANIEVVAQPLLQNGAPFGAVVVGVMDTAVTQQVNTMLLYIFIFSLIPIALAIGIAYLRARALTRNVLYLTDKADQISRGDLEESVELKSHDELENLSEALERMRISMKEALDRLRRRRI